MSRLCCLVCSLWQGRVGITLSLLSNHPTGSFPDWSPCWELWTIVIGYNSQSSGGGKWSYLLLSSALPSSCLFPPPLPLPHLPGALETPTIKEKLTHDPDNRELHGDCFCFSVGFSGLVFFFPVFLSAVWCLFTYSFPLQGVVVLSLTFFYFFCCLTDKANSQTEPSPIIPRINLRLLTLCDLPWGL